MYQNTAHISRLAMAIAVLSFSSSPAFGQDLSNPPTREDSAHACAVLCKLHPTIVRRTTANDSLHLYGSASEDLVAPKNGVADARQARLHRLAEHFAPILIMNTDAFPINFPPALDSTGTPTLQQMSLDLSKLSAEKPAKAFGRPFPCNPVGLKNLLAEYGPEATLERSDVPESSITRHFYYDFPGDDARDWLELAKSVGTDRLKDRIRSKIYVHPFIQRLSPTTYELVFQYWFYYFFNDGANDHEGDWEHLNVVVGLKGREDAGLSKTEIADVLTNSPTDRLDIKRLDYYFHHKVITLDTLDAQHLNGLPVPLRGTHPLGHIGGNSKGWSQIVTPRGRDRDTHGTFPWEGAYMDVGPFGESEVIQGSSSNVDSQRELTFQGDDLVILPDWENLRSLANVDPSTLESWIWMLLPVHCGQPFSNSRLNKVPADIGSFAPFGPPYNSGWNRTGACAGYQDYQYEVLAQRAPTALRELIHNGWGTANALALPRILCPVLVLPDWFWGTSEKFLDPEKRPPRIAAICGSFGTSLSNNAISFLMIENAFIRSISATATDTRFTQSQTNLYPRVGAGIRLYLGSIFSSEFEYTTYYGNVSGIILATSPAQSTAVTFEGDVRGHIFTTGARVEKAFDEIVVFARIGYSFSLVAFSDRRVTRTSGASISIDSEQALLGHGGVLPNLFGIGLEFSFLEPLSVQADLYTSSYGFSDRVTGEVSLTPTVCRIGLVVSFR